MPVERAYQYKRKYMSSPTYPALCGAIVASGTWTYDYSSSQRGSKKYLPFNNCKITNNSSVSIKFYINQGSNYHLLPAGTILTLNKNDIKAFYGFKIVNASSTTAISAGELEVSGQNVAYDSNNVIADLHKRIVGILYG